MCPEGSDLDHLAALLCPPKIAHPAGQITLSGNRPTPAQQFTLNEARQLVNTHSGMCLGAVGQSTANGALIEQRGCSASSHLQWTRK
ncbi:RICIN domain-containing protein [Micromonospora arborensis]|uniref:RICIN domain-containing protein n=1 Tax=Micromonospora arborensis TaxID=2116518 RepID=UPI00341A88D7